MTSPHFLFVLHAVVAIARSVRRYLSLIFYVIFILLHVTVKNVPSVIPVSNS